MDLRGRLRGGGVGGRREKEEVVYFNLISKMMVLKEYYKILKMSNLGLKKISVNILNERKQIHTGICCWFMNIRAQEYVPAGMCGGL